MSESFSVIFIIFISIISNGLITNVKSDKGYIINDTKGTNIKFISGESIFILKKLFICIGKLAKNAINEIIRVFDI